MRVLIERFERYAVDVILERREGGRANVLKFVLGGLSKIYTGLVQGRLLLYRRRYLRAQELGCQVVSIGNLTVGGSGKTPVAREILRLLRSRAIEAHALSRGYGGRLQGPLRVDPALHSAAEVGDDDALRCAGDG